MSYSMTQRYVAELNSDIQKYTEELRMLEVDMHTSKQLQSARGIKPSVYVEALIETTGDRRMMYRAHRAIDTAFTDLFICLWPLNTDDAINSISVKCNTLPELNSSNTVMFIKKSIQQLRRIIPYVRANIESTRKLQAAIHGFSNVQTAIMNR